MHTLDWILMGIPLVVVLFIGLYTQRYMKSVAGFMSGGRVARRYLLAVARGEMQCGAAVFVALFEVVSHSGFTLTWWQWLHAPIALIVTISGFVFFRFRETRAMTLAQFFEVRYSKSFRVFTGMLAFVAGVLNFGIIPAVGARFFVYLLGFPPETTIGSFTFPTYIPLMGVFITITLALTLSGGLLTVMVTDCVEGIMSQVFFLILIASLMLTFTWPQISHVLSSRPAGQSFLNPFDAGGIKDFNLWLVLMQIFVGTYATMAWQNTSAYNSAAVTPHESRMSGILSRWREMVRTSTVTLLAICAVTFLHSPDFTARSAVAKAQIAHIHDPSTKSQMEVPIALSNLLPTGIRGVLCAILIMGIFGGDSTHLHSWGGIFVQDVLVPLRKKPFEPKEHIKVLRLGICGVALFAFIFGSLFQQTQYILMWWAVTTAVYVGGAGAAIIGGLYWKKGTAAGAWAALIVGSSCAICGIVLQQIIGTHFPLNGLQVSSLAAVLAIGVYVAVSWLTFKEDFNMDRMLHRGEYTRPEPSGVEVKPPARKITWGRLIGYDENFTLGDKWVAGCVLGWSLLLFVVFAVGSIWNLRSPWPVSVWSTFWHVVGFGCPVAFAIITGIWFSWGGCRDICSLFRQLKKEQANSLDDGTVVNHQNLADQIETH